MKKLLIAGFVLIVLLACNKNKFQTKPQISIKSISPKIVPINSNLNITLSYTDKEGDISDSIFLRKIRLNKQTTTTLFDSLNFSIPEFPNYDKGEISIDLDYGSMVISAQTPPAIPGSSPLQYQPDTLDIKIWMHDKAGHSSDTISTGQIIVIREP